MPARLSRALAAILATAALGLTAYATAVATRPPAQPTAVATVDVVRVLEGLNEKTTLEAQLRAGLDARRAQLDQLSRELETLKGDLEAQKQNTPEYRDKVRQAIELSAQGEARRNVLERIISVEKAEMLRNLYTKIEAAVAKVSEQSGYDVVLLDDSSFPLPQGDVSDRDIERAILTRSVVYTHPTSDITSQVITLMNNEYRAP
jgi:Skp family chaperone for outer membrane proteins